MRYIKKLNRETLNSLKKIQKESNKYRSRDRARAILLSLKGKNIREITDILGYSQRTIYRWFDRFENNNIISELKGRGRKNKLNFKENSDIIKKHIKKTLI
jgi:transposase